MSDSTELLEKLSEIHGTLEGLKVSVDNMNKTVAKHDYTLTGNGGPGLLTRVDRIEQTQETRKWHFRTMWGAMLVVGLKLLGDFIYKR